MTVEQVNKIADQLTGVQFQMLTDSEILNLSVAEIKSPRAFDETGAITEGGLYDLRLGATKNEKCHTCMLGYFGCAGHFGHISLPLPIYNPFLIRLTYQLMELCCTGCHRLVLRPLEGELLLLQLDLLDLDMEHCCSEVKEFADEFLFSSDSKDMTEEEIVEKFRKKLSESNILKTLNERRKNPQNYGQKTLRSVVEKKHQLVKDFLRRRPMSFLKECLFCNKKRTNYSILNNATILESAKEMSESDPGKPDPLLGKKILENMEKGKRVMHPISVRSMFRKLWMNEKQILSTILPFLCGDNLINIQQDPILDALVDPKKLGDPCPLDVFFNQQMLVTPSKFRPLRVMQGRQFEDSKSSKLSAVISSAGSLSKVYQNLLDSDKDQIEVVTSSKRSARKSSTKRVSELATRETATDLFYRFWTELQINCNLLYDAELTVKKAKSNAVLQPGLKQLIEKKEGLFRKNMMGKRVNYAARSVISPDPYIMVDEIGFPEIFAKRLSFPEPVNDHNYEMLQELVQNGPDIYPGAMSVVLENGTLVRLNPKDVNQRKVMAQQVAVQVTGRMNPDMKVKVVNRHLRSGDVLLINRQPTLHKPSIMAHRARVLPGERTIRLHYANCKCYNADFDGDEMNAHFPQSFLTRAEGYNIVSVNYQYLVPKDGTPLSGLIQDHIVAATLLTYRGQFLSKVDYQNLVYAAVSFLNRPIKFLPPTILKPEKLWSGKQVASTIILNLVPDGKQAPTLKIASKLKPSIFISEDVRPFSAGGLIEANELCESQVIIREGELLVGAFDKSNLGNTSYGIVHTYYELYGGQASSALLTAFARLANAYLQSICGFTLGIYDILLTAEADKYRKKMIHKSTKVGDEAVANAFNVPNVKDKEAIFDEFQEAHTSANPIYMKILDASVKSKTDEFNNNIAKKCLPGGLLKPFPYNHLQMMIQPGAKGGLVNALQISCLLGQIELEGKRVPLMISGKTLPSFKPYETSPKAGGFVTGRFLTGIRPQEFFFHCMAGREGLIDTAVKTSRSGYLQRCLIKHLEGLVVNYDSTVRDSDHTVIQFLYGEDGLDILKSQLLKPKAIPLLAQNLSSLRLSKDNIKRLSLTTEKDVISNQQEVITNWELVNGTDRLARKRGTAFPKFFDRHWSKNGGINADKEVKELLMKNIYNSWNALTKDERCELNHYCMACPDPVCFRVNPGRNFGVISEKMEKLIQDYISFNPDNLLSYKKKSEDNVENRGLINVKDFKKVFHSHYMKSLVEPGEAVGLLAAQSIGEPSTQMTLNTFHFAGRGEMNVTLGIPRLREILMTASPNISTPSMDIPIRRDLDPESVEHLADQVRIQLTSTTLADVLEHVDIVEKFEITPIRCSHLIILKFKFLRRRYFKHKYPVSSAAILEFFEQKFLKQFGRSLKRKIEMQKKMGNSLVTSALGRNRSDNKTGEEDENDLALDSEKSLLNKIGEDDDDDSDDENGDGDADDMRNKGTRDQEMTYEEPEDEEKERSDSEDDDEVNESILPEKDLEEIVQQDEEEVMDAESINWGRRDNVDAVLKSFCKHFFEYKYDQKKEQWCELTLDFDIGEFKLDLASLIQEEVSKAVMHKVGKIDKAFLVKNSQAKNGEYEKMIKTEGVSFLALIKYSNILDLNRIYSNDIHAIANTYGIEAGRRAIISEMVNVFGMYGIEIDSRHLYLIADYMTSTGVIKGMNRQSMLTNASPIQQITFETSMNFIKMAAMLNTKDELNSPSSRIFVGRPVTAGSGISQCVMGKLKNESLSDKKEEGKRKFLDIKMPAKRAKLE